jgi:hypothetical protein
MTDSLTAIVQIDNIIEDEFAPVIAAVLFRLLPQGFHLETTMK